MKRLLHLAAAFAFISLCSISANAADLDPAVQGKIDAFMKQVESWAKEPAIVNTVKEHNANLPADQAAMTQDKWKSLTVLDPFVRAFTKNDAATFLKGKKSTEVGEAFLSGADGLKVAFLSKTSNWSHKGKPKHDVPMTGKTWQGPAEVDESTGLQLVQIAVPVMDGDKPIGSLVVGLIISKL